MVKLKPCPFCKNDIAPRVLDSNQVNGMYTDDAGWRHNPYFQVVCCVNLSGPIKNWKCGCGGSGGFMPTKEAAILAWNRRAEPENIEEAMASEVHDGVS